MSIYAISWVLQHSEAEGGDRLVLIALADYARDDGGGAFPSVANIQKKARLKSRRAVQYALRRLEDDGRIEKSGVTPKGTNVYRIVGVGGANSAPRAIDDEGGRNSRQGGAQIDALGAQPVAPNPSIDPSTDPSEEPSPDSPQLQHPPGEGELWIDDVIKEVFAAWHSGTGMNGNSKLTPERKKKIRLRLEEASADGGLAAGRREVLDAVGFVVHSDWHRANGHQDFTLIFRSRDSIEKYAKLERQKRDSLPPPPDPRFAGYDTTTPNPELEGETDAA